MRVTSCELQAASYQLQATSYKLQATSLQATSCKLQAASYKLHATSYKLQATSYKLQATSYTLHVTNYKLQAQVLLKGLEFLYRHWDLLPEPQADRLRAIFLAGPYWRPQLGSAYNLIADSTYHL